MPIPKLHTLVPAKGFFRVRGSLSARKTRKSAPASRSNVTDMINRLWPFAPAILAFVGAFLVAAGGFWAAFRQSNFNATLREKNEEISRLQHEQASAITGGDSFAWIGFQVFAADGGAVNANSMPEDLLLVPNVIHQGKYPLYDVNVRIHDTGRGMPFDLQSAMRSYALGNLSPSMATITNIRLPHHGRDFAFNIFFSARNGMWVQFLRMPWVDNGWALANKVVRGTEVVYREVSANFPRREDGSVDWGEPGAQDVPAK